MREIASTRAINHSYRFRWQWTYAKCASRTVWSRSSIAIWHGAMHTRKQQLLTKFNGPNRNILCILFKLMSQKLCFRQLSVLNWERFLNFLMIFASGAWVWKRQRRRRRRHHLSDMSFHCIAVKFKSKGDVFGKEMMSSDMWHGCSASVRVCLCVSHSNRV